MVTRRIKKETTSRFFASAADTPSPTPRRITRASLAKFALDGAPPPQDGSKIDGIGDLILGADIEDAVTRIPRKRKRSLPVRNADTAIKLETASSSTLPPPRIKDEIKGEIKDEIEDEVQDEKVAVKPRRARKPARKALDPQTGESHVEPPSDWLEIYNAVLAMRQPGGAASNAAVDTMGCERLADRNASPRDQRFHTLVSLMLSSQTKDTVNAVVMAKLKTELPAWKEGEPLGLNLENMLAVDPDVLNQFIWAVGFHNNKTKYLKQTAVILRDKWNSDIPDTIKGLTSLPGVGPKMAHLCLSAAWNRTEGIGVDVHVHRLTNLWGWHKTSSPEATRLALESWLPRDKWREINWLLVGFGQTVCPSAGRRCGDCDLGLRGLCRAADRGKVLVGRRAREVLGADDIKLGEGVEAKIKVDEGNMEEEVNVEGVRVEGDGATDPVVKAEAVDEDVSEALAKMEDSKTAPTPAAAPAPAEESLSPRLRTPGKRRTRRR